MVIIENIFLCFLNFSFISKLSLFKNKEKNNQTKKAKDNPISCKIIYYDVFPCCSVQFSSFTQSCLTLCDPMDCSMPGFPVHHQLQSLLKLMSIELVMPSNHLIFCHPLLLLPSIFPSIRVFFPCCETL